MSLANHFFAASWITCIRLADFLTNMKRLGRRVSRIKFPVYIPIRAIHISRINQNEKHHHSRTGPSVVTHPSEILNPMIHQDLNIRGLISDGAKILSEDEYVKVSTHIKALNEKFGGMQVAIVTIEKINGITDEHNEREFVAFGRRLFNTWGVGSPSAHNGVLFLLVIEQRQVVKIVGIGFEKVLTAQVQADLMNDVVKAHFRAGQYGAGICIMLKMVGEVIEPLWTSHRELFDPSLAPTFKGEWKSKSILSVLCSPFTAMGQWWRTSQDKTLREILDLSKLRKLEMQDVASPLVEYMNRLRLETRILVFGPPNARRHLFERKPSLWHEKPMKRFGYYLFVGGLIVGTCYVMKRVVFRKKW